MRTCINGATTMPYTLEQDIENAGKVVFEGVELWVEKVEKYLQHHSPEDLKAELQKWNLQAASLCGYGLDPSQKDSSEAVKRIGEAARVANAIGCPILLVFGGGMPEGATKSEAIKKAAKLAREFGEACAEFGVKIALEPLGLHSFMPGPREALQIAEEAGLNNIGIMMDTFHYYKSGVSIDEIASIPIKKLLIVHINDCEQLPREQLTDAHRLYPGLGVIPLREMLGVLKQKGYDGFLSVEIFREEYWKEPPEVISKKAKEHLDRILTQL